MAIKITMPQLGESVTEGTISKWLVKAGDVVNKYDALAEVSTDKVIAEVPSTVAGRVTRIVAQEGETVAVGGLILYIEEEADADAGEGIPDAAASERNKAAISAASSAAGRDASLSGRATQASPATQEGGKTRYSPAVLHLAQQHGIDLTRVSGTGAGGRVTRKDVQAVIEAGGQPAAAPQPVRLAEASVSALTTPAITQKGDGVSIAQGDQIIPVSPVRRTIAQRMVQSKHDAPHAWMMVEVDVTNLVQLRNRVKDDFKRKEGISLTYLPFFIKAVVEALKEYPMVNSTWAEDKIIVHKNINISIAVATEDALFVPVIKDADQKSILGIAQAVEDLAARARAGKLTVDDMTGGTFTVNNTGTFGSVLSMPIINSPQAAILSVESIVKRPVIVNDMIAIRSMVNLCLSLDHRVLDGLISGRFLQSVKNKLESIGPDTHLY